MILRIQPAPNEINLNKNTKIKLYTAVLLSFVVLACGGTQSQEELTEGLVKSEIRQTEDGTYSLYLDGELFYIQGAGLEFGSVAKLAENGANSFRTWRTDNGQRSGKEVLDEAHEYGLKVTMFMEDGTETESVDAMHYLWNNEWPSNRTPRVNDFKLQGKGPYENVKLKAAQEYSAMVDVTDPEGGEMVFRWEIMEEGQTEATGGDAEVIPQVIDGLFAEGFTTNATFTAPSKPRACRIFVYVDDTEARTAHADIPFLVEE